jgi:hypothetical protein
MTADRPAECKPGNCVPQQTVHVIGPWQTVHVIQSHTSCCQASLLHHHCGACSRWAMLVL